MIHLALRTEFSFKDCFMHMDDIHKYVVDGVVGVADLNNTFAHPHLERQSKKYGFKPIYGVRLHVVERDSKQRTCQSHWIFLAKNQEGLKNLNVLVSAAYDQFYYFPRIFIDQALKAQEHGMFVIAYPGQSDGIIPVALGQGYSDLAFDKSDRIAIDNNMYPTPMLKDVVQLMAGAQKRGDEYISQFRDQAYPCYIMNEAQWLSEYKNKDAVSNANYIAHNHIEHIEIPKADMVKWKGSTDIKTECMKGAIRKGIDLDDPEYKDRLDYELNLIIEKDYVDYFLITADLIKHAKKSMLVGPARGSSAGSLVCYLLDITEVDPIEHTLIFERFIDVNRFDLPDIDVDFPDTKRENVIKYLIHKYGRSKVRAIANVNRFKPKSAIGEFAKSLGIPPYETDAVKGAIIERSSGDARAAMCIMDTFETTEPGKEFIEKYPKMELVRHIEGHASHTGKHAAGIIVSTLPLTNYGGVNSRDDIIMMDKKDAEYMGLLKIDCLGLRTLSILEDAAIIIGEDVNFYYNLPLDDKNTFDLFNSMRLDGIFQFEGQALQLIVKQMGVRNFNDVSAITALARPGALNSGGTARYIKYVNGNDTPDFYSDVHRSITGDTFGIVVYQEQMMEIARMVGQLSWADTSDLRRAASKSMGDEFFGKYKDKFIEGAIDNGYTPDISEQLWNDISSSGSWSFNKSHAVSYGLISYWTAWLKANHPMAFAVASLNNARDDEHVIKLLRDMVRNEGMDLVPLDPDRSELLWTHDGNTLIGGLTNMSGIGPAKAKQILNARKGGKPLTEGLFKKLMKPETPFDIIFPAEHYWGFLYNDPVSYGISKPSRIVEIDGKGSYVFLGCLIDRNVRDLNEHIFLTKRNGEIIEEDNLYLNFKVEDDTDMISCKIDRFQYEELGGKEIAESGKIGKDWYLIKGRINGEWRRVDVEHIVHLNKQFEVKI